MPEMLFYTPGDLTVTLRIPPDVNSGGTLRNVPPLLSHRSLYALRFDGYDTLYFYFLGFLGILALLFRQLGMGHLEFNCVQLTETLHIWAILL